MPYRNSQIDKRNLSWFSADVTRASLLAIKIISGEIRGLKNILLEFRYPITAIAGKNGSGKTTILALAACAFHTSEDEYHLPDRKLPYYTFKDFFIQTKDEIPLDGIYITYQILFNKWRPSVKNPKGEGPGWQLRKKKRGGRWANYERRVPRAVVYLGINRIVPHAEKSVSKSYNSIFENVEDAGWEDDVKKIVGIILDRDYSRFNFRQHSHYRLPIVKFNDRTVSGFNMGAGEDALFELISTILDCPEGTLVLVDEIELGLHEEAQKKLINELKKLCENRHIQVICTTHSASILDSLPPEGRIYLEKVGDKTHIIPGISSAFASGKLGGRPSDELVVLVEDDIAAEILKGCLTSEQRNRLSIIQVGSATAVMRHLATKYIEGGDHGNCVFLDGDQVRKTKHNLHQFLSSINDINLDEATNWFNDRVHYLPGNSWPEAWLLGTRGNSTFECFNTELGLTQSQTTEILDAGLRAGKHNEIFEVASRINYDEKIILYLLVKAALLCDPDEKNRITSTFAVHLDSLS